MQRRIGRFKNGVLQVRVIGFEHSVLASGVHVPAVLNGRLRLYPARADVELPRMRAKAKGAARIVEPFGLRQVPAVQTTAYYLSGVLQA